MSQPQDPDAWVSAQVERVIEKIEDAQFVVLDVPVKLRVASVHPAPDGTTTEIVVFRLAVRPKDDTLVTIEDTTLGPRIYGATLTTQFSLTKNFDAQVTALTIAVAQQIMALSNDDPARKVITFDTGLSAVRVATVVVVTSLLAGALAGLLYYLKPEGEMWRVLSCVALALAVAAFTFFFGVKSKAVHEAKTPKPAEPGAAPDRGRIGASPDV